jgi:hypothetical protein
MHAAMEVEEEGLFLPHWRKIMIIIVIVMINK